jgi:hypothetical protein
MLLIYVTTNFLCMFNCNYKICLGSTMNKLISKVITEHVYVRSKGSGFIEILACKWKEISAAHRTALALYPSPKM